MRSGASVVQHLLSRAALGVIKHAVMEARRRGHPQVQPLHVVSMLLTHAGSSLRQACMLSDPQNSQTADCRILEDCFSLALDHLPQSVLPAVSQPILSNALLAALKRAHAHQRRGCSDHHHRPLLALKVEVDQLIISILDDPSVKRVMTEAGFSSASVKFNLEDGPADRATVASGVEHVGHEQQPAKHDVDMVSQGEAFSESSCVIQEQNDTKSSVMIVPGAMDQTNSMSLWQESEVSQEGERREIMMRASSRANQMVGPRVSFPSREEDIHQIVEILLAPRKRNPILIGSTTVGANCVVEDLAFRIKNGNVPAQLQGLQFLDPKLSSSSFGYCSSLEMEQKLAELSKIVEECMPAGAILHIGDLQWLAEPMQLKKFPSTFCPAQRTASELRRLLIQHANNRLWFVGVVTPNTFNRLQVLYPSLVSEWSLQAVQVNTTFQPPQPTFLQRLTSNRRTLNDQQTLKYLSVRAGSPIVMALPSINTDLTLGKANAIGSSLMASGINRWNEKGPIPEPVLTNPARTLQSVGASPMAISRANRAKSDRLILVAGWTWSRVAKSVQHLLTPAALGILKHAVRDAVCRGNPEVQPLHVISTLLTLAGSQLRQACVSHPQISQTECRVLEFYVKLDLDQLRSGHEPTNLSAALILALKKASLIQQPSCPLSPVKVEIDQLIISLLDDPSVTRVMNAAGLSRTVKDLNLEDKPPLDDRFSVDCMMKDAEISSTSVNFDPEDCSAEDHGAATVPNLASGVGPVGPEQQPSKHPIDVVSQENSNESPSDTTMSDCEFISALKKRMEAISSIQIIDIKEALSRHHWCDQATIILGFFNVASDNLEFCFENGESMAQIVGVGLPYAKVIVKRGVIFEVQEIETNVWMKIWLEMKECSNNEFKIMKVKLPRTRGSGSGQPEAGSHVATSSTSNNQDYSFMASRNALQVPFLWELSKKFIMDRVINAFQTKCNDGTRNESFEVDSMEDDPKDGDETVITWFQSLKVLFSNGTFDKNGDNGDNRRHENQEGGGGNGDGNGNGGNDDFPGDNSKVDLLKDKVDFAQVHVILLSGGDFFEKNMEPLSNRLPLSIERLDNVKITPELTFGFCKSKSTKKIQITTSAIFALDRDCDSIGSCGHFGWFHDEMHASFGPLDRNIRRTVVLKHDFKEGESVSGKTTNKASVSKDSTKGKENAYQVGLAVGSSQVARIGLGANMKQQVSYMDHQSNEQSLESQCNQTYGGFKIQAKHMMHEALLEYKYLAPYFEIVADQIQDRKYRYDLSSHPMCNLQKTEFLGTWVPIGNDEVVEYIFKADRQLHEIRIELETSTSSSSGFKTLFGKRSREYPEVHVRSFVELPVTQAYEKQLYVNHAMTHLVDGQTYTLIESSNQQSRYQDLDAPLVRFPILVNYQ